MLNPYLHGNFAPVTEERTDDVELPVTGVIPPDLEGRLLRNGPNPPVVPDDEEDYHWFSGDGMIHAISLAEGRATGYRNRWVRTRALSAKKGTPPPRGPGEPIDGPANTHVIRHAGTTLALVESGFPHALSPGLERARVYDFDGALASPMTAHPKVDPDTGELVFFGSDVFGPPFLRYHVADAAGALVRTEEIEIPRATMMHDFGVTATRVVFLDLPVVFELGLATVGRTIPYEWVADAGARIGVMPRTGGNDQIRWIGIDPTYVFHVLNCYDDSDNIVMDVVRYDSAFDTAPGEAISSNQPVLARWTIDPVSKRLSEQRLDDTPVEFPAWLTRWPDVPTGTATAPGSATAPTNRPSWVWSSTTWPATSRPASNRASTGFPGRRYSSGPSTAPGRTRVGYSRWSTTPPGTPATWSFWTPPRSAAPRWPPSTSQPGSPSGSTGRGCQPTPERAAPRPGAPTRPHQPPDPAPPTPRPGPGSAPPPGVPPDLKLTVGNCPGPPKRRPKAR